MNSPQQTTRMTKKQTQTMMMMRRLHQTMLLLRTKTRHPQTLQEPERWRVLERERERVPLRHLQVPLVLLQHRLRDSSSREQQAGAQGARWTRLTLFCGLSGLTGHCSSCNSSICV